MRVRPLLLAVTLVAAALSLSALAQTQRLNPVIALLEKQQPVFGVYAPANGGRGRAEAPPPRPAADLVRDALAYPSADFLFNGSLEGGIDRGWPAFNDFLTA